MPADQIAEMQNRLKLMADEIARELDDPKADRDELLKRIYGAVMDMAGYPTEAV